MSTLCVADFYITDEDYSRYYFYYLIFSLHETNLALRFNRESPTQGTRPSSDGTSSSGPVSMDPPLSTTRFRRYDLCLVQSRLTSGYVDLDSPSTTLVRPPYSWTVTRRQAHPLPLPV